jgi:hypothetical protein
LEGEQNILLWVITFSEERSVAVVQGAVDEALQCL